MGQQTNGCQRKESRGATCRFVSRYLAARTEQVRVSYTKVDYRDVDPIAGAMHFLRDPLDCEQLGVTVVDCDPGWEGKPHDHADEGQEEVYVLLDGEATVVADGDAVEMESGDALRLAPETTRQIQNGETESTFILVGAP